MDGLPTVRPLSVAFPRWWEWAGPRASRLAIRACPIIVIALLLLPHAKQGFGPPYHWGQPRIISGDEPHYLVAVTSLVRDGDLNLGNNYDSSHRGGIDAGIYWRGVGTLDNHTSTIVDGRQVFWKDVYQNVPRSQWRDDGTGRVLPPVKPGQTPFPPGAAEYSYHQTGIALLLAPVMYPFRHTDSLETVAVICSGLATVLGYLFTRLLFSGYGASRLLVEVAAAAACLSTPVWFYGRTFFLESFMLCFLVGAYALSLRKQMAILPGVLLGLAVMLKAYAVLFALPLLALFAWERRWRDVFALGLPLAGFVAFQLGYNWYFHGSPFTPPQPFDRGSFREGFIGQLFNRRHGLIFAAPSVLVPLVCWPRFLRAVPREGLVLGSAFLMNLLLLSHFSGWCGESVGPRYLMPFMPFLFAAMLAPSSAPWDFAPLGKLFAGVLLTGSLLMNGYGAMHFMEFWHRNPLLVVVKKYLPDAKAWSPQ